MSEETAVEEYRQYGYRWVVLLVYGIILVAQAVLWLSFAPIESDVEKALGVGSTAIRALALVGPLMFVFIGSYAGDLADRRGFKFAAGVGAVICSVMGIIRAIVPHVVDSGTAQYWLFLVCQAITGAGGVFIVTNMSKMPIKWFREKDRALGIGLATMFFYLGTAAGYLLVTTIAGIPEDAAELGNLAVIQNGLNRVLTVFAVFMAVSTALFFLLAREDPPTPSGPMPEDVKLGVMESLRRFMGSSVFRALATVSLVGYGIYMGMAVTMEKIITFHGFTAKFAASVATAMILGGILGAATLPGVSEKLGLRKPFLILAGLVPIPMMFLIGFVGSKPVDLVAGALLGFFLLAALPVTFTITGEMEDIGPRLAGSAAGTLMAIGSIGSFAIPFLMEAFKREAIRSWSKEAVADYRWAIVFLAALGALAIAVVILWVKETGPRARRKAA
ncbi:MFS transporter [Candidatus Solincola tengchongensis]|uniref:MFS transporter n=1 Tax=Candidatus Solincola tengchongensis TaxID=2900693 RepID=UPI00257F2803|nr:MFS transporter [Candidatus Solincola tengchongensis]